jgi:DNA-binding NarL/FixJ family response regulator
MVSMRLLQGSVGDVLDPRPGHVPVTVRVAGSDPLIRAGVAALLDGEARVSTHSGGSDMVLAVVDGVDQRAVALVRSLPPNSRILLVPARLDAAGLALAVSLGVLGVLLRANLDRDSLCNAVASVSRGEAVFPPALLGQLLGQQTPGPGRPGTEPRPGAPALSVVRLTDRERAVLSRVAEGADTREIARALAYSERTVKTVIQDLTRRFGVRNRPQAVAYALRHGLI